MLKSAVSVKEVEHQAAESLRRLLEQVPAIKVLGVAHEEAGPDRGADFVVKIDVAGRPHALNCEVRSSGQPRHARMALLQLRNSVAHPSHGTTPIFIAPYLTPEVQALCRDQGAGFLDFHGNARVVFDGIFIECRVAGKPVADRRELRSLFKPKSAQVLRVMLRDPHRAWRVSELSQAAGVSLGHVSNVRAALLDREWARVSGDGLSLCAPDVLLDGWRDAYDPPAGRRTSFYTTLHGGSFEDAARVVLSAEPGTGLAAFASFSAAHWLAPHGRTGTQYFYADEPGLEKLRSVLKLSATSKGENVVVTLPKDLGLFRDTVEPAPGAVCTSPVQTYLDLAAAGERGREAADHLRKEKLAWQE